MKAMFLFAVLLVGGHSALALTFAQASENLLYFEYAKQSAEHCGQRGVATGSVLAAWNEKHLLLSRKSIEVVRAEAEKRGLSSVEQQDLIVAAIANQRRLAIEHIARKGVPCARFGDLLDGFSTMLKQ